MSKPSLFAKISFWTQFLSAIGSLVLKDGTTKQKVINIANGVSTAADGADQAKDQGML